MVQKKNRPYTQEWKLSVCLKGEEVKPTDPVYTQLLLRFPQHSFCIIKQRLR